MDNNQQLKLLMDAHKLSNNDVATILGVSIHTVNSWTSDRRNMRDNEFKYLELLIKERGGDIMNKWHWKMDYCKKLRLAPAKKEVWIQAEIAYRKRFNLEDAKKWKHLNK